MGFWPSGVSRIKAALTASVDTARYRYRISPASGRDKSGGMERACLRWERECSHSSVHSKAVSLRKSLNKGRACWANLATNLDSDVSMPFRFWIDFFELGMGKSEKALHLSGLASIPLSVRQKPRNFPARTP